MRRRTPTAVVLATIAAVTAAVLSPTAAIAATTDHVPGTKPTWLSRAHHLGSPSQSAAVSLRIYLAPRGGLAAMEAEATAVSTPGSADYGKFLSVAQYQQRYAPDTSKLKAVESWATAAGLKVSGVAVNNEYISVTTTVALAQKAFSVSLQRYSHDGQTVQAPTTDATLPSSVAADVLTVSGLDTTRTVLKPTTSQPAGFRNAPVCSTAYGTKMVTTGPDGTTIPKFDGKQLPASICGYVGPQLRSAYEGKTSLTGAGVTVGILGAYASPSIAADAATYAKKHGDTPYTSGQITQTNPSFDVDEDLCGDPTEYYGEETLDVESFHAMAGGAKIHYYGVTSCDDRYFEDTYEKILDQNSVQIVSTSYGDTGEDVGAAELIVEDFLFARGALQGISFLNSSGDEGDETIDLGTAEPDFPASSPFVTAVGGTATAIDAKGELAAQTGWGTDKYTLSSDASSWTSAGYLYGSGGGVSAYFPKPGYQAAAVAGSKRVVPDVAMDGDPTTGMLVGETQTFSNGTYYDEYRVGGTSLSSPLFAGMTALTLQAAGHRAGLLNPLIYKLGSKAFTDVTSAFPDEANLRVDYTNSEDASGGYTYSVRTFDDDSSLQTTKGYDEVTGVGVPNTNWLSALR